MLKINRWKRRDIILLVERLEMYISSGLTLNKTIQISSQGLNKKQKSDLLRLENHITSGGSLSKGLKDILNFPATTVGLVNYGESSGSLSKSLITVRNLLEREDELLKKFISALIYPLIIGLFSILLVIGLIKGIMSQIIPLLKSLNIDLPLITKIVIFSSEIIIKYGLYIFLGIVLGFIIFRLIVSKSLWFRRGLQYLLVKIPIVGKLFYHYHLSVFLYSCGALVESGIPLDRAYLGVANNISFLPLNNYLNNNISDIKKGTPLGLILNNRYIPNYVSPLLVAGESSGSLGLSILRAGSILDKDIQSALHKLTVLVEPAMMMTLGIVVGSIAVSIMIPIYSISSVLQK